MFISGDLLVTLAKKSDSGQYICEVINEEGIDIASSNVLVKGNYIDILNPRISVAIFHSLVLQEYWGLTEGRTQNPVLHQARMQTFEIGGVTVWLFWKGGCKC